MRFVNIENQKNGDDMITASQIITILMINWIIAHPYVEWPKIECSRHCLNYLYKNVQCP